MMGSFTAVRQLAFVMTVLHLALCEFYCIVPSDSPLLLEERKHQNTQTLEDFEKDVKHFVKEEEIVVEFSPGEYLLKQPIYFNGTKAVTLTGNRSESGNEAIVKCLSTSGFKFENVWNVSITHLVIAGCIEGQSLGAGVSVTQSYRVSLVSCFFIDNLSHYAFQDDSENYNTGGGALGLAHVREVLIKDCLFRNNSAYSTSMRKHSGGGAISFQNVNELVIEHSDFVSNNAQYGGAVLGTAGNLTVSHSNFTNNRVSKWHGGAINLRDSGKLTIRGCLFKGNYARMYGGAVYTWANDTVLYVQDSCFESNRASNGSAFEARDSYSASSENTTYIDNVSGTSGSIYLYNVNVASNKNDYFLHNTARYGGAILSSSHVHTVLSVTGSTFIGNRAVTWHGGAINIRRSSILYINNCLFDSNYAKRFGGAVHKWHYGTEIHSKNSLYINNTAESGGAVTVKFLDVIGSASFINNSFTGNVASKDGGALYLLTVKSVIQYHKNRFTNNSARRGGAVFCRDGLVYFNTAKFVSNLADAGSLFSFSCQITFQNAVSFLLNTGGAISSVQSSLTFSTSNVAHSMIIANNTASYGGGVSMSACQLFIRNSIEISGNAASISGGGIYADQSSINITSADEKLKIKLCKNNASLDGGGIIAVASTINMEPSASYHSLIEVTVCSNTAGRNGGGLYLKQNTKVHLRKHRIEKKSDYARYLKLSIVANLAQEYGGGVFVSDRTGPICYRESSKHVGEIYTLQNECFIQTISFYGISYEIENSDAYSTVNTFLVNNTAGISGSEIYGGLLDRCAIHPFAEVYFLDTTGALEDSNTYSGFDYLVSTVQQSVDKPFTANTSLISSDPVQVLYCIGDNFSRTHTQIKKRKGEVFSIEIVAVDQLGHPVNATIISSVITNSSVDRLKEGQTSQVVGSQCTELEFNVYSKDDVAQLKLYADGPCIDFGLSKQTLDISFSPCTCPLGFQPIQSDIDCKCDCDELLQRNRITKCFPDDGLILLEKNIKFWIGVANDTNGLGYILQDCPFDYCITKPANVSLGSQEEIDVQCAFERTGNLCGKCKEGLSLVFSSSECQKCTNYYIFLIIPFGVAGLALVAVILWLNVTVAIGTTHGLIFYVNTLAAGHSAFKLSGSPTILTMFASWLNLDLGIETCFYDGMDSQAKVLLQLAFPAYLFLLVFLIIILCEHCKPFSKLLSNRNPVATLCTIILLSYSKLLRTIIVALQYTYLDYPDESHQIVWLYDANVPYFKTSHIPRFIIASFVIALGTLFTILLFFGQWLFRFSNRKIMKWIRSPKYNAFIDAYHAPFSPRHRYWVGLLLFARILLYLVIALTVKESVALLLIACITLFLLLLKMINVKTYKNWMLDILESSFLINLAVLSVGTYHVRLSGGSQTALTSTSISIAYVTLLGIVLFHLHKYIFNRTRLWDKLSMFLRRHQNARMQQYPLDQIVEDEDTDDSSVVGDLPSPNYNYADSESESTISNSSFEAPIIRSALKLDQLREPALDVLDPVTDDHYREIRRSPSISPRPPETSSFVDRPNVRIFVSSN